MENKMNIRVSYKPFDNKTQDGFLGYATVVFDDSYELNSIRITEGAYGSLKVQLPQFDVPARNEKKEFIRDENGNVKSEWKDVLRPVNEDVKGYLISIIKNGVKDTIANGDPDKKGYTYEMNGNFQITKIYTTPMKQDEKTKPVGLSTVTFGDAFVLERLVIRLNKDGELTVSSPQRKSDKKENGVPVLNENGENVKEYTQLFHPITTEAYSKLLSCAVDSLNRAIDFQKDKTNTQGQFATNDSIIPFEDNNRR